MLENTVAAENSILIHPQEQAAKIRMEKERQKWVSVCVYLFLSQLWHKKSYLQKT